METYSFLKKFLTAQWILMSVVIALLLVSLISYATSGEWMQLPIGLSTRLSSRFLFGYVVLTAMYVYSIKKATKDTPLLFFINTLFLAIFLDGFGNAVGLYEMKLMGLYYDKYLHFFAPFIMTLGLGYFLLTRDFAQERKLFLLILVVLLMAIGGSSFEVYEFYSDKLIGTDMVHGEIDTLYDIYMDFLGVFLAGIFLSTYILSDKIPIPAVLMNHSERKLNKHKA